MIEIALTFLCTEYQFTDANVGGALLTSLHSRTSNGDPFIRDFSSRLLRTLSVPFFTTLSSWIYSGELKDPFNEFFVELNPGVYGNGNNDLGEIGEFTNQRQGQSRAGVVEGEQSDESGEGRMRDHELWEGKFSFKREMLPGFLEESFGRKVSSTTLDSTDVMLTRGVFRSSQLASH